MSAPPVRSRTTARLSISGVYARLLLGVAVFVAALTWLVERGAGDQLADHLADHPTHLAILGGFLLLSWMAPRWLRTIRTQAGQWALYLAVIAVNTLLFLTPVTLAERHQPGTLVQLGGVTLAAFVALTALATALPGRFRAWRRQLNWLGLATLAAFLAARAGGVTLGVWYSLALIALAGAAILSDTQRIRTWPAGRETAAALRLFSSLTTVLWHLLRLSRRHQLR